MIKLKTVGSVCSDLLGSVCSGQVGSLSAEFPYPPLAKEKKLSGRVWVSFIVSKDGRIEKTMLFKPMKNCDACNQEALRLVASMPKWTAATKNNKPIKNNLRVAIDFKLK